MTLGELIKKYRDEHDMSQADFAQKSGISKGYVSMLENNRNPSSGKPLAPSYTIFEAVASVIGCSPADLMAKMDDKQMIAINVAAHALDFQTDELMKGVENGSIHIPKLKGLVFDADNAKKTAANTPELDCPVIPIYNALNESGRKEYIRYGRYLTAQPDYLANDAEPQVEYIRHYLTAAAAGYAAPIEGEDYEEIPLPADAPLGADFCLDIDGDSMEPYIKNGSRVYVKRGADVRQISDVGIFFLDGDVFCKQWCLDYAGTIHLLSANPKRETANKHITRNATTTLVCFGKVLLNKKLPEPSY